MAFAWPDAAHRFCFDSNYDWIWWIYQSIIPKTSKNCCFQALFFCQNCLCEIIYLLHDTCLLAFEPDRFTGAPIFSLASFLHLLQSSILGADHSFNGFFFWSKVFARFVFCVLFLLINCKDPPCLGCRFRHHFGIFICFWFLVSISRYSPYLWFEVGQIS